MNLQGVIHQGILLEKLNKIFSEEIQTNFRKSLPPTNENNKKTETQQITNKTIELDLWIPKFNLCFEFQDSYHYIGTWYSHKSLNNIQNRDKEKNTQIRKSGITLIVIPCWWDGNQESLEATIRFYRPDLLPSLSVSSFVSLNPPHSYFQQFEIPEVGELMAASFPLLSKFSESISTENSWWLGEKYDGIRCCWNFSYNILYSRTGREIELLPNIKNNFPFLSLDSEFWFGRGQYFHTQSLLDVTFVNWHQMRIISFDSPTDKIPFEKRYENLLNSIQVTHPFNVVASRVLCESKEHCEFSAKTVIDDEGEGVILRKPKSVYEHGRSQNLIKIKAFEGDQEAMVVGLDSESVTLKLPNGITFSVPQSDVAVPKMEIGEIISFSVDRPIRRDIPSGAKVYRVRKDLSWLDLVIKEHREKDKEIGTHVGKLQREWDFTSMRKVLEKFARNLQLNPLDVQTWYSMSRESFIGINGIDSIFNKMKGGYIRTLQRLFPELNLDYSKFLVAPKSHWSNVENRKDFFRNYAKENKFEVSDIKNWDSKEREKFIASKHAKSVVNYHKGSIMQAVHDLFPSDLSSRLFLSDSPPFVSRPRSQWADPINRRVFFEEYCKKLQFDLHDVNKWYMQPTDRIMACKGARGVMSHHKGSVATALIELFPYIHFDKSKLPPPSRFLQVENRRQFFEKFAYKHDFDPFDAPKWYEQKQLLLATKGIRQVLFYHSGSIARALIELFPEVKFDKSKFPPPQRWNDVAQRRKLFEDYALFYSFDYLVADNWYSQPRDRIASFKGASGVLYHHNGSVVEALTSLFPNIGLQKSKFMSPSQNWRSEESRKKFFVEFANTNSFDPYVSENWNEAVLRRLSVLKGVGGILHHHDGSLSQALIDLFPNIGLDKSNFSFPPRWKEVSNRRLFFEKYAEEKEFDPLLPENWYSQPIDLIMEEKGAERVIIHHSNSIPTALRDLFPEIGFDSTKFQQNYMWKKRENRKQFFIDFAQEYQFNPLVSENWYSQPLYRITSRKGAKQMLVYYERSVPKALMDLFPDIGINKSLFITS